MKVARESNCMETPNMERSEPEERPKPEKEWWEMWYEEMRMFWARTKFWSLPTLLRWWLRQGREEELCYGNLEVICDDNRSLGILVGTEVSFDWLEELMRGKKVEKACCVISRRRLSLKDSEESWIWVAEIVGARENICKTGKNES